MARGEHAAPSVEPDIEEVQLTLEGSQWVVRVLGRAGAARTGATPLLLIGFWPAGATSGTAMREAFVVARTLADAPAHALERAWAASRETPAGASSTHTAAERRGG